MDGYQPLGYVVDELADFDDEAPCVHCRERWSTHETQTNACTRPGHRGFTFTAPAKPEPWTPAAIEQYLSQDDYTCWVCKKSVCSAEDPRHDDQIHAATEQARRDISAARKELREKASARQALTTHH